MLSLVRPRYFVPIHGEYRQLSQHARVAERVFAGRDPRPEVLLAENGDMLHFDGDGGAHRRQGAGRPRPDRRHAHRRGRRRGAARPPPSRRGRPGRAGRRHQQADRRARRRARDDHARLRHRETAEALLADGARAARPRSIEQAQRRGTHRPGLIKEKLRVELRRFFRKRSGRRPFVLPVVMEI